VSDDLYKSKERLQRKIEQIQKSSEISERNKIDIVNFEGQCETNERLAPSRILTYMCYLEKFSKLTTKDFVDFTKDDVIQLVGKVEREGFVRENEKKKTKERFDYSPKSLVMMRVGLKKFFRFLRGVQYPDYPEEVRWLRSTVKHCEEKLPEIFTPPEMNQVIDATENSRDKAFVSVAFESATRPSELINLKIKNVFFDDFGAFIVVSGKTGSRKIRLILSASYLATWLDCHPGKQNPENKVWVGIGSTSRGMDIGHRGATDILKKAALRAGIRKKVYLYLCRHSRLTQLAQMGFTNEELRVIAGWKTQEPAQTYLHISGAGVEEKLLKKYGLKPEDENDNIEVVKCPRCKRVCPPNSNLKICSNCGLTLDLRTSIESEEKMKILEEKMLKLLENPEIKRLLLSSS